MKKKLLFLCLFVSFILDKSSIVFGENNNIRSLEDSNVRSLESNSKNENGENTTEENSKEAKQKILNEFKEKLLNEQEIKRELDKNITLTNEDLDVLKDNTSSITLKNIIESMKPTEGELEEKERQKLIKEEREKIKQEEERLKKEANRLKKEEERIKKEEEKIKKQEERAKKMLEDEKEKEERRKEKEKLENEKKKLEESKKKLEEDNSTINKLKSSISNLGSSIKNISISTPNISNDKKQSSTIQITEKPGVLTKIYNITDTGVSEEFLYSREYKELISNRTTITKIDTNKENDIPILNVEEKNIINFQTSNIPQELLSYRRTEENKHIPTIILAQDLQAIARKAIEENNLSVLRGIIEQTKDPDFLVSKNLTMLFHAIENQKYILVRYLLYSGASINKIDNKMNNSLHISIMNHNREIAELLINNGVDINAQNIDGDTPLMLAIITSQDDIAIMLLKNGANLKLKNNIGETAMDICDKNKKYKIKQYIKDIMREEELYDK